MDGVRQVSAGDRHTAILKTDGTVWITGMDAQTWSNRDIPRQMTQFSNAMQVSAGGFATAVVLGDGSLWTWGLRMIGDGFDRHIRNPVKLADDVAFVSVGYMHSVFVKNDGALWAWGRNTNGELGDGTNVNSMSPKEIMGGVKLPASPPRQGEIGVLYNGRWINFDQPPILENGRTLVPVRAIFEAFGAELEWVEATQTVISRRGGITVILQIGNNTMYRNGVPIQLDVAPRLVGGRTLVPVRAVSEGFGMNVDWDGDREVVIITG
jgi:hypothetical protein